MEREIARHMLSSAAAEIAIISSLGDPSGFIQPCLMGFFRDRSGEFEGDLVSIALLASLRASTPAMVEAR